MCRNIRTLHNSDPPATSDEVHAAALQYVRKVSGSTKPSQANQAAFDEAVEAIAHATAHLLEHLTTTAPPKDREVERQKARERNAVRFGTPARRVRRGPGHRLPAWGSGPPRSRRGSSRPAARTTESAPCGSGPAGACA